MQNDILKVDNISKSYKDVKALKGISFAVKQGEFFALLGPNGAGKSTTIKILTTLLKSDGGKVSLNDNSDDIYIRNQIGVVFQENVLDELLTVKENLMLRGGLYFADKSQLVNRYNELKEQFGFEEFENKKFKLLSGGQKRRIEIARALFASPQVLLLDEPTTGLDPESRKIVWEIINNLKAQKGLTVILTTHYMEETSDADQVMIIDNGKVVAAGSPSELKLKYAKDIFKIAPKDHDKLKEYLKGNNIKSRRVADVRIIEIENPDMAIEILQKNRQNIISFELIKGSMDDVFLKVIGEKII